MMRQAHIQYQNKLMSKTFDSQILKTVEKEVFNSNASKTMTNFADNFLMPPADDLEQMFQDPGKYARNSINRIKEKQNNEE